MTFGAHRFLDRTHVILANPRRFVNTISRFLPAIFKNGERDPAALPIGNVFTTEASRRCPDYSSVPARHTAFVQPRRGSGLPTGPVLSLIHI